MESMADMIERSLKEGATTQRKALGVPDPCACCAIYSARVESLNEELDRLTEQYIEKTNDSFRFERQLTDSRIEIIRLKYELSMLRIANRTLLEVKP